MRSTRGERYRRRILAESRGAAFNTARKVGDILDRYVLARRGELTGETVILWNRIALALGGFIIFLVIFIKLLCR